MTTKTRYFVIASLLTLAVGLGAGLAAYSMGFSTSAASRLGGPDELRLVPATAAIVAYADVREIMTSDLRQRLRNALPMRPDGQQQFQNQTGINIETDIDHVVVAVLPAVESPGKAPGAVIVLARGQFDQVKIEQLMRDHGAQAEDYKGSRVVTGEARDGKGSMSVGFLEPGLVAVGSTALVRGAVDLQTGGSSVATNDEIMGLVRDLDSGNAWAVGHFDALTSQASLPGDIAQQIPAISLFSATAHIDSGIRGTIRADTRDAAAGDSLRDVVRGFLALAKMQMSGHPELASALQALEAGGTGKTVSLSFDLPAPAIDSLAALAGRSHQGARTPQQ